MKMRRYSYLLLMLVVVAASATALVTTEDWKEYVTAEGESASLLVA